MDKMFCSGILDRDLDCLRGLGGLDEDVASLWMDWLYFLSS